MQPPASRQMRLRDTVLMASKGRVSRCPTTVGRAPVANARSGSLAASSTRAWSSTWRSVRRSVLRLMAWASCMAKPTSDVLVIELGTDGARPKLFPPREDALFIVTDLRASPPAWSSCVSARSASRCASGPGSTSPSATRAPAPRPAPTRSPTPRARTASSSCRSPAPTAASPATGSTTACRSARASRSPAPTAPSSATRPSTPRSSASPPAPASRLSSPWPRRRCGAASRSR